MNGTRTLCARKRCKRSRVTVPLFTSCKRIISIPTFLMLLYTRYKCLLQTLRLPLLELLAAAHHRSLFGCCICSHIGTMERRRTRPTSGLCRKSRASPRIGGQATRAKLSPHSNTRLCFLLYLNFDWPKLPSP